MKKECEKAPLAFCLKKNGGKITSFDSTTMDFKSCTIFLFFCCAVVVGDVYSKMTSWKNT